MRIEPRVFYQPEQVVQVVRDRIEKATDLGEHIDYLTFVPDGEPTLDGNLGEEIKMLRPLGTAIAVISNASLVWRPDVREALAKADWVSLKVDSVKDESWRRTNRPHGDLRLASILEGIAEFARVYRGELVTETMLVRGVNDDDAGVGETARFIATLDPRTAYLSVPTRPPADEWVRAPTEVVVNRAFQAFNGELGNVEYLVGYEGTAFGFTGNAVEDLLGITSVHPMRKDAVQELLDRDEAGWSIVEALIAEGRMVAVEYEGDSFYMRRFR